MPDEPILILKMGSTLGSLRSRRGDFDAWIAAGLGIAPSAVSVVDLPRGDALPTDFRFSGVVVSGSHSMVTERLAWSERAAAWLLEQVPPGTPVLGICYGHQLLARAHGGEVADNPRGREYGTRDIALEPAAKGDDLMGVLPAIFPGHEGHTQSVLRLPEGAVRLAANAWDANQAFRIGERAWGVQFHPEFDAEILRTYIDQARGELAAEGQDPLALRQSVVDSRHGRRLLRRFARLCAASRKEPSWKPGS